MKIVKENLEEIEPIEIELVLLVKPDDVSKALHEIYIRFKDCPYLEGIFVVEPDTDQEEGDEDVNR